MPALPPHSTPVTERSDQDCAGFRSNAPNDATALRGIHAWRDPNLDADTKAAWSFPHHATPGGPAVLSCVRAGLSRLSQADIPDADRAGVERHLRRHLEAQDRDGGES